MFVDTLQALVVITLGVLPGALYMWAFEREVGAWGVSLADRIVRFFGASALFQAVLFPLTQHVRAVFVLNGDLHAGKFSWLAWSYALLYVLLPDQVGRRVGRATRLRKRWPRFITGQNPAPRAWDHLFGDEPAGLIRLRMRSGRWLGGVFAAIDGRRPYAAGFPHAQDLYLADVAEVDAEGDFALTDEGDVRLSGNGLLVRWDDVEYLEFIPREIEEEPWQSPFARLRELLRRAFERSRRSRSAGDTRPRRLSRT